MSVTPAAWCGSSTKVVARVSSKTCFGDKHPRLVPTVSASKSDLKGTRLCDAVPRLSAEEHLIASLSAGAECDVTIPSSRSTLPPVLGC